MASQDQGFVLLDDENEFGETDVSYPQEETDEESVTDHEQEDGGEEVNISETEDNEESVTDHEQEDGGENDEDGDVKDEVQLMGDDGPTSSHISYTQLMMGISLVFGAELLILGILLFTEKV